MLKKFEEWLKYIAKKNDGSNYSDSTVYKYTSSINTIKNELIVRRKMFQIDLPEQRRLPTPNLLDSMRRSNSLKPLLDTMDAFVRRGKRFAVVTNQIRFTSLILQTLQDIIILFLKDGAFIALFCRIT